MRCERCDPVMPPADIEARHFVASRDAGRVARVLIDDLDITDLTIECYVQTDEEDSVCISQGWAVAIDGESESGVCTCDRIAVKLMRGRIVVEMEER